MRNKIAIIGGADGPTSVFVAGKVNDDFWLLLFLLGILLAVIAIAVYRILKKRS